MAYLCNLAPTILQLLWYMSYSLSSSGPQPILFPTKYFVLGSDAVLLVSSNLK